MNHTSLCFAFAFPAEAGPNNLPTMEGWKDELALTMVPLVP